MVTEHNSSNVMSEPRNGTTIHHSTGVQKTTHRLKPIDVELLSKVDSKDITLRKHDKTHVVESEVRVLHFKASVR